MWLLRVLGKRVPRYWVMTLMNENGLGKWETEANHRREERKMFHQGLVSPLGMGSESIKWPQHADCYRAVDETWKLIMEERRE